MVIKPTLTEADFQWAAMTLQCEVAAIKAICEVESPKGGFNPDGSPTTLFEGHQFHKHTKGRFTSQHPTISHVQWTRRHYGTTWQREQERLQLAMSLDREAALKSASWGRFQIMGFNYAACGYQTLQSFINAMYRSERGQLEAFVGFMRSQGLVQFVRRKDWAGFARRYNGPGYADNAYDKKMAAAYRKHGGR